METMPDPIDLMPELIAMLGSECGFERAYASVVIAAAAAQNYGSPALPPAVPALIAVLDDDDFEIRRQAVFTLEQIGEPAASAAPALCGLIADVELSDHALMAFWTFGRAAAPAVPCLMELLNHGDALVRANAATALGVIGPDAAPAVLLLIDALDDLDSEVRVSAAFALGSIGEKAAPLTVPALREVLGETDEWVCTAVVRALGAIGKAAAEVLPDLERLRSSAAEEPVRHEAADAMRLITTGAEW